MALEAMMGSLGALAPDPRSVAGTTRASHLHLRKRALSLHPLALSLLSLSSPSFSNTHTCMAANFNRFEFAMVRATLGWRLALALRADRDSAHDHRETSACKIEREALKEVEKVG